VVVTDGLSAISGVVRGSRGVRKRMGYHVPSNERPAAWVLCTSEWQGDSESIKGQMATKGLFDLIIYLPTNGNFTALRLFLFSELK